ncbi:MAG TPA: YdcF family protein [Anaerolineales bacterium]|nr:YdcF family protein [Anaerolineales bacterium]
MKRFFRWLFILIGAICLLWSGGLLTLWLYGRQDRAQPAPVIVVLGAKVSPTGRMGPALQRRVAHAWTLWQKGLAQTILCTGGNGPEEGNQIEAEVACSALQTLGVPESAIVLESRATSTGESATWVSEILRQRGITSAIIVSDGYHLARTHWLFAKHGITTYPSPAQATNGRLSTRNFLTFGTRELLAWGWYWLTGVSE